MRLAVRAQTMFSLRLSLNRRLVKHMKNTFRKFGSLCLSLLDPVPTSLIKQNIDVFAKYITIIVNR